MSDLYVGRVIKVHQHDHSLDIQLVYDGSHLTAVPLLSSMMTTSSGNVDIHHPEGNEWNAAGSPTRDIYVVVSKTDSGFIALGFLAPQVNQMAFDRKDFKVNRHASDVYSTVDKDGNIEIAHPSGTFVRIATSPDHENLAGQDFDALWAITRNTAKNVWLSVAIANAGGVKATFKIDPSGNVALVNAGNLTVNTTGNVSLTNGGTLDVHSTGAATVTAASIGITGPTTITGTLAVNGSSLTHNGTNVGDTHVHSGVTAGPATTGGPQ